MFQIKSLNQPFSHRLFFALGALGLTLVIFLVTQMAIFFMPDSSPWSGMLKQVGRAAGFHGWVPPMEWLVFCYASICLVWKRRLLVCEKKTFDNMRHHWQNLLKRYAGGPLNAIQVRGILHKGMMATQSKVSERHMDAAFHYVLERFSGKACHSTIKDLCRFERDKAILVANRALAHQGLLASVILGWGILRAIGRTSDMSILPPLAPALILSSFLLSAASVARYKDLLIALSRHEFFTVELMPQLAWEEPFQIQLVENMKTLGEVWVKESEKTRETIHLELRSGILKEFLGDFSDSIDNFTGQNERMLKRLHEKMLSGGDKLRLTAERLQLYVEHGGVADMALLHKSVNDFREVVNDLSVRFGRAEQLIQDLGTIPGAVDALKSASHTVRTGGEKTDKLADQLASMTDQLQEIGSTMAREVVRNGEIHAATDTVLSGLTGEIASLKGVVSSIHVSLSGIQQVIQGVQQAMQRLNS